MGDRVMTIRDRYNEFIGLLGSDEPMGCLVKKELMEFLFVLERTGRINLEGGEVIVQRPDCFGESEVKKKHKSQTALAIFHAIRDDLDFEEANNYVYSQVRDFGGRDLNNWQTKAMAYLARLKIEQSQDYKQAIEACYDEAYAEIVAQIEEEGLE